MVKVDQQNCEPIKSRPYVLFFFIGFAINKMPGKEWVLKQMKLISYQCQQV